MAHESHGIPSNGTNGNHIPNYSREEVRNLRLQAKGQEAKLQLDYLNQLSRQVKESSSTLISPWVAFTTDRLRTFATSTERSYGSSKSDRLRGRNAPMFGDEQQLSIYRQLSRIMCATNNYAIGLIEGITSYVVGDGFNYRIALVDDKGPTHDGLIAAVQAIVDEVQERNSWWGGEEPNMEEELFWRSCEDGEFFVQAFVEPQTGWTQWRTVEPEFVTTPPHLTGQLNWTFGVRNKPGDVQTHEAYWIQTGEDTSSGREFSKDAVTHFRRNVKRSIKRGFPDFAFDVYDSLDNASKLRRAIGMGAALQASIAGIREHQNATKAQVSGFVSALEDWTRTNPITGTNETTTHRDPGTFLDIPEGLQYIPPPGYANANDFVSILQSILRGAGQRWNAPEWLSAASVNETVYASALVGESPFVRTVKRRQTGYAECFRKMHWRAVRARIRALGDKLFVRERKAGQPGQPDQISDKTYTWDEIKKLVRLQVEPASVEVRDKAQEASANIQYLQSKVKSPQTIRQELGLDSDQEDANFQEFEDTHGQAMPGLEMPGDAPGGGADNPFEQSTQESLLECKEGPNAGKPGPCPSGGGEGGADAAEPKGQARAKKGGEYGPNGEWYKGGAWIATTDMPKKERDKIKRASAGKDPVDFGKWEEVPPGQVSILAILPDRTGARLQDENPKINEQTMAYYGWNEEEAAGLQKMLDAWKRGERTVNVLDYPGLVRWKDVAKMVNAGMEVPGASVAKLPKAQQALFQKSNK